MTNNNFEREVMYKLGSIEEHLKNLNGSVIENKKLVELTAKKVSKHEVIIGKAGMIFVGIIFILTTAVNFSLDWIKGKF